MRTERNLTSVIPAQAGMTEIEISRKISENHAYTQHKN